MDVYSEFHTKHINTVCGQNGEFLNVKLVVHIPLDFKGLTTTSGTKKRV